MKSTYSIGLLMVVFVAFATLTSVDAGQFEDGLSAHKQGDYTEAIRLWKPLARQGLAEAQYNLGMMYQKGNGVPQDDAEAVKWYRKAAKQSLVKAHYNLGVMYDQGKGVTRDDAEAVKWYRKAAGQGNALAQNNLGLMYTQGKGVTQDYAEAVKWYRKAAEQGDLPQNVNYAVKAGYVRVLLSSVDPTANPAVLPAKKDNLTSLADRVVESVLMVVAQRRGTEVGRMKFWPFKIGAPKNPRAGEFDSTVWETNTLAKVALMPIIDHFPDYGPIVDSDLVEVWDCLMTIAMTGVAIHAEGILSDAQVQREIKRVLDKKCQDGSALFSDYYEYTELRTKETGASWCGVSSMWVADNLRLHSQATAALKRNASELDFINILSAFAKSALTPMLLVISRSPIQIRFSAPLDA